MSLRFLLFGIIIPFFAAMFLVKWIHPIMVDLALDKDLVDNPDARKLQKRPVPVLGGVAVYWGIIVGAGLTSMFFSTYALFPAFVVVTVMMYVGTLDDIRGLSPLFRFIVQIAAVCFIIYMDRHFLNDFHGTLGIHHLPLYVSIPLSIVTGVGITNGINLIDGVDGLSSGLCVFICAVFGSVFILSQDGLMIILAFLCMGALLPFFFHNVFGKNSKMFIGDSGTLMMGIVMTIFVFHILDDNSYVARAFPNMGTVAFTLACLSIPVFDTVRVMSWRIMRGKSPFLPDKSHIHHLFIEEGFSHAGTTFCVITLDFFNVVFWALAYFCGANATVQLLVVLCSGSLSTVGLYAWAKKMNKQGRAYKCFQRMARVSHIETKYWFHHLRVFLDK